MDKKTIVRIADKRVNTVFKGSFKTKEVDGERRIMFVASSAKVDRHYETVDVASLRLPLKGGGFVVVESIPEEGIDMVDIPLMMNHSADVKDTIGSVRRAYFENNELLFECGMSSREIAKEMLILLEEGHLSNAFSITMSDYDYNFETETISGAEVLEVSLVYRGSNKEARLITVKSLLEGDKMDEKDKKIADLEKQLTEVKEKQNDTFGDANGDGKDHSQTKEEVKPEVETKVETKEEPEKAPEKKEKIMNKEIAKDMVEKEAKPVQSDRNSDYLSTKSALTDFRDIVLKFHRGSNDQIMKSWMENLKAKAITGDAILPSRIEQIFFKTWSDNPGILGTFRFLNARSGAVYAMSSDDKAQGHAKGETKDNQDVTTLRRDLKGLAIYKKLPIDMQDLFDDESGELLAFRTEELASHVANAIAIGAILGQGTGSKATLQATRGLYPMITDINATSGFGTKVATKVTGVEGDGNYQFAIRALGAVKDENNRGKILIVPTGFSTEMRLMVNSGTLMFPVGVDLAKALGVKAIFEIDELVGNAIKAIAYADQSYVLVGQNAASVRTDFDLTANQDVMLVERYVGGSQQGYKTLAGVVAAA